MHKLINIQCSTVGPPAVRRMMVVSILAGSSACAYGVVLRCVSGEGIEDGKMNERKCGFEDIAYSEK